MLAFSEVVNSKRQFSKQRSICLITESAMINYLSIVPLERKVRYRFDLLHARCGSNSEFTLTYSLTYIFLALMEGHGCDLCGKWLAVCDLVGSPL